MLHTATVAPHTLELLKKLMQKPYLKDFKLVGGTALSLQIGHRISVDLDLFCNEPFETPRLKSQLEDDFPSLQIVLEQTNTILATIDKIKIDFIRFKYEFKYPIVFENEIRLTNIRDIAPMKMDAISGRGRKRDFFDLYFLLQEFSLPELLKLYEEKYKHTTIFHVIKSLNYFDDAEEENEPIILNKKVTWTKVKKTIVKEIQKL